MRIPGFLLLLIGLAISAWAADPPSREPLSVSQLEEIVSGARTSDHEFAHRISGLELTERLNADKRAHLAAALPGSNRVPR